MSLLKVFKLQKRGMWLCKNKKVLKNGQVFEISKTMGTQIFAIKKEKERKKMQTIVFVLSAKQYAVIGTSIYFLYLESQWVDHLLGLIHVLRQLIWAWNKLLYQG
jgi:hypothetical protein